MSSIYWLNKESRTFLERGYLKSGVTPEIRIRQIADRAQAILDLPGFADRFEHNVHLGWYSLSSPIWANFGAGRGLPISCVVGDTWINTRAGGKQAKDIVIGDELLTHRGRFRPVTDVIVTHGRDQIYELKVNNRMTPTRLTGNHLVMTNLGWVRVDELKLDHHLVAINGRTEHDGTDYIIDMQLYCKQPYQIVDGFVEHTLNAKNQRRTGRSVSMNHARVHHLVPVDADLAWAIGLWFAEGSLTFDSHKEPNGIRVTLCSDERHLADRWLKIMTERFNLRGHIYDSEVSRSDALLNKVHKWITVNLNGGPIGRLFNTFGRGRKEKTLPEWAMSLPLPQLEQILIGLLAGDGSIGPNGDSVKLTLANPVLLLQVYLIGLKLGKEMSLQMQDKPSIRSTTKHVYTILFRNYTFSRSRNRSNSGLAFHDGLVYSPISSLVLTDRRETVYDFTVAEDHSFSASGIVLHNCFGSYIDDTTEAIFSKHSEIGMMTKHGGGTSAYFGDIRPRGSIISTGGKSDGPVRFMELFDKLTSVISQSNVRRGQFAAYLPVEHPDIHEFLQIGDKKKHPIQDMSIGVCISDEWMQAMTGGDKEKQKIWAEIIKKKNETGYPYLFFTDTVNRGAPQVYKDKGMKIHASNLCSEICLSSSNTESFVCDLSSMNLLHYDEWKDTDAVEILTYFLDAVMSEFITLTENIPFMQAPRRFAINQRALGVGVLGWHSYLQSRMIAFESIEAKTLNNQIHRLIQAKTLAASREMALRYGEPELLKGYGVRNVTTMAIAPTTSSSFILGQVSPSIEPLNCNYFVKDLSKIESTYRNPFLKALLVRKGRDDKATWENILVKGGSVQHLDFLDQHEKDVFKTFGEISAKEILIQAASRQRYIDQGQSLNLMIPPGTPPRQLSKLLIEAWSMGIKCIYYTRGSNPVQQLAREILSCASCQ